ncbi:Cytochrome P450 71A1 [Cinnamomum micranthum f. kanehirae]|uniref:Cytochrome P450 71A1 n=1 Tax=Cinnamomum micranthum f. kanehirae TaxID=337451 RepID=A0A443NBR1_9MAGN|nr:Cytochrome P450 71A1 [Cinnamomum micranthum f. kanehirae]
MTSSLQSRIVCLLGQRPKSSSTGCTDVAFASYGEYWRQGSYCDHLPPPDASSYRAELFLSLTSSEVHSERLHWEKKYDREGEEGRDKFADLVKEWDMFTSGTDTTLTLEWVMAELAKHPNVMKKAQGEETLRLHPPAPLLVPRESTTNVMIQNFHIPPKTRVFINAYAIGRDPTSWENPEEFLPERFANNSIDFKGQDFQFIPFGAGRRVVRGFHLPLHHLNLLLPIFCIGSIGTASRCYRRRFRHTHGKLGHADTLGQSPPD